MQSKTTSSHEMQDLLKKAKIQFLLAQRYRLDHHLNQTDRIKSRSIEALKGAPYALPCSVICNIDSINVQIKGQLVELQGLLLTLKGVPLPHLNLFDAKWQQSYRNHMAYLRNELQSREFTLYAHSKSRMQSIPKQNLLPSKLAIQTAIQSVQQKCYAMKAFRDYVLKRYNNPLTPSQVQQAFELPFDSLELMQILLKIRMNRNSTMEACIGKTKVKLAAKRRHIEQLQGALLEMKKTIRARSNSAKSARASQTKRKSRDLMAQSAEAGWLSHSNRKLSTYAIQSQKTIPHAKWPVAFSSCRGSLKCVREEKEVSLDIKYIR